MSRIRLRNVSVDYVVNHYRVKSELSKRQSKSADIGGTIHGDLRSNIRALDSVSFELKSGDRLGLMGRNGVGKTTLLKVVAGIIAPTAGDVLVEGRISPLTSISLGLDGQSSGYDNIFIRSRLMGYSKAEILEVIDDIGDFTGLNEFLHLPIRTYSSGMKMRLSFAIATAFKPDIMLLDEWIGTGDAEFREQASERLHKLIADSGIFIFASHNRALHRQICNKAAILDNGRIVFFGNVEDAFVYLNENPKF